MKAYLSILRQQMIGQMQYRAGFWAGTLNHIFWGVARAAILVAFYLYGQGEADITMRQAVSMVWLQQVAGSLVPGWNTDIALYTQIRSGDVAYELLRPMDAYAHWYVKSLAGRLGPFLLALVPVLGAGYTPAAIMTAVPGGFLTLGLLMALINKLTDKDKK